MDHKFKVLVAAGGTGGHLFPAMAVVSELERITNGQTKAVFVGTNYRIESKLVPDRGYEFYSMPIRGITGFNLQMLQLPIRILRSIYICNRIIKKLKPNVVICTGAYISYPAGVSAKANHIPLVLLESNLHPGKSIKMLASKSSAIVTSFEETRSQFNATIQDRVKCIGNPLRPELFNGLNQKEALHRLGLPNRTTILVFGGSLGANSINSAIEKLIPKLGEMDINLIWQTGSNYISQVTLPNNTLQIEFISDIGLYYSASNLAICRSGATTIAELTALGLPSILVPLETASNNEQKQNAEFMVDRNASIMILNNELEFRLETELLNLLTNNSILESLASNSKSLGNKNAAEDVAKFILEKYQ